MPLRIYEKHSGEVDYWTNYWSMISLKEQDQFIESNFLTSIFYKYLSKSGEILEGGCGLGRWVLFLNKKGYKISGIEWSDETVNYIKKYEPDIPIKIGDIFKLKYPDNFFQSYISLGVIEHHENYQMALNEAYRVISNDGYLLCSVPYFNPVRQIKKFFGAYKPKNHERFFEYRFRINEIRESIRKSGFEVIEVIPFSVPYGLTLEIPFIKNIRKIIGKKQKKMWYSSDISSEAAGEQPNNLLKKIKYILESYTMRYLFGHMVLVIGKKCDNNYNFIRRNQI